MYRDLTHGSITKGLLLFALPMIAGNLLQQLYNIADTLIVGQALGRNALAAVGSAYTLMVFLTSIFLGLSMGAGALFSICLGLRRQKALRAAVAHAFALIGAVTLVLNLSVYLLADPILRFLQIPHELYSSMRDYLLIIFGGLAATFLYNFFACLLRAGGKLRGALVVPRHLRSAEYRAGPAVRAGAALRRGRSGSGHGHRAVCFRRRTDPVHDPALAGAAAPAGGPAFQRPHPP